MRPAAGPNSRTCTSDQTTALHTDQGWQVSANVCLNCGVTGLVETGFCQFTLHYIKSYLECPKSLGPLEHYEIKGVIWEHSYEGKHLEKR